MLKKEKELPKIFELEYLAKEDLTENDLHYLFDKSSLIYSLIQGMHRITGDYTNIAKIVNDSKHDNGWINRRHFRSKRERDKFISQAIDVIKNVYQYSDYLSKRWVDDFMFHYGFSIYKKS